MSSTTGGLGTVHSNNSNDMSRASATNAPNKNPGVGGCGVGGGGAEKRNRGASVDGQPDDAKKKRESNEPMHASHTTNNNNSMASIGKRGVATKPPVGGTDISVESIAGVSMTRSNCSPQRPPVATKMEVAGHQLLQDTTTTTTTASDNTSIAMQKQRAIRLWDEAISILKANAAVVEDDNIQVPSLTTLEHVHSKLYRGMVPPIFHAYCAHAHRLLQKECLLKKQTAAHRREAERILMHTFPICKEVPTVGYQGDYHPNYTTENTQSTNDKGIDSTIVSSNTTTESGETKHPTTKTTTGPDTTTNWGSSKVEYYQCGLSANRVHVGEAKDTNPMALRMDVDYSATFFTVEDQPQARAHVQDTNFTWHFSPQSTLRVAQLINTDARMVGEDIEVTSLTTDFGIGTLERATTTNLITRRLSRGIASECLARAQPKSFRVIVGSKGIGKSWSLIYVLQQALLYNGACVVFHIDSAAYAYTCIRQNDTVYCWMAITESLRCSIMRDFRNVLLLVDPSESTRISRGEWRVIMPVASYEMAHNHRDITQNVHYPFCYLSAFTKEELHVALPEMLGSNLTQDESDEIFGSATRLGHVEKVGLLPRYLLNISAYDRSVVQLNETIEKALNRWWASADDMSNDDEATIETAAAHWCQDSLLIGYDGATGAQYTISYY